MIKRSMKMIDTRTVSNVLVEDIDYSDCPDFCDAFISECDIAGVPANEVQLDELNEDYTFRYKCIIEQIY